MIAALLFTFPVFLCPARAMPQLVAQNGIRLAQTDGKALRLPGFMIGEFKEPSYRILTEIDDQTQILLQHLIDPSQTMEVPVVLLRLVSPYAKQSKLGAKVGVTACATAKRNVSNRLFYRNPRIACAAFTSAMFRKHGVRGLSFAVNTQYPQLRKRGGKLVAVYTSTRYVGFFKHYRRGDLIFFHRSRNRFGHLEFYCGGGMVGGTSSSVGRVGIRRIGNRGFSHMTVLRL
jgi:hypothetical protein